MATKANAQEIQEQTPDVPQAPDDVDKIRDIIFGGQMREYAARFDALEKKVETALENMSRSVSENLERLETVLRARSDEIAEDLAKQKADIVGQMGDNDAVTSLRFKELQEALEAYRQELADEIGKSHEQLSKSLAADTGRLERDKVASEDLAQMLMELGRQLARNDR